jgi:poly-gamma-glutamate synthesis protein (capsule biosynthesis protein)
MMLRNNPGVEQGLKNAGFTILSLANNHIPNFGEQGLKDTFNYLHQAGIYYVGAGNNAEEAAAPVFMTIKGTKFAFLAYNDTDVVPPSYEATQNHAGTNFMRPDRMTEAIKRAKQNADIIIVSMHAGTEYTDDPNQSQITFAHAAIDAGADLVIGHHPHVIQPLENYKGKYILYSLGNFVFDQMWSEETRQGLTAKIFFTKTGVQKIEFQPILIEDYSQPRLLQDKEAEQILTQLKSPLSKESIFISNNSVGEFLSDTRKVVYGTKNIEGNFAKSQTIDLDKDGQMESYQLNQGHLTISSASTTIWQSPQEWWVDNFELADSNNDGMSDINLSVWKSGNFGPSKPFWIAENDLSIKNHFFVIDLVGKTTKPIWQSSNLTAPNCEFKIADIDKDGKNDLVVIEGDYADWPSCKGKNIALWKWNGWGFSNEWRSVSGTFSNLEIEDQDKKRTIAVDTF